MRELRGDRGDAVVAKLVEANAAKSGDTKTVVPPKVATRTRVVAGGPGGPEAGRRGPGGPPPMLPKPEELFAKFDKDNDEKLSKEEFKELTEFVHEHMPHPPLAGRMVRPDRRKGAVWSNADRKIDVFAQRGPDDGPRHPRWRGSTSSGR